MSREKNAAKRERKRNRERTKPGQTPVPRWQIVENLVAAVERQWNDVPGATVTQKAMVPERTTSEAREVDILVSLPAGPRRLLLGIDVKHWDKRLDIEDLEQLGAKFNSLPLDRYCVVSTSGFTERARNKAQSYNVELRTYEQVRHEGVFREFQQTVMQYESVRSTGWTAFWGAPDTPQPDDAKLWAGVSGDEIKLSAGDKTYSLSDMLTSLGRHTYAMIGRRKGDDAPTYEFTITVELQRELKFARGEDALPLPTGLVAEFVHERIEKRFENLVFRTEGALAQATVVEDPFGNKHQINVVTTPRDGKLAINVSLGEALPRRTST